ncbi:hypothetical protein [Spirosoma fluviale]|uniref:Dolichyl-phosphate-mannose-protein mannosyltransferase n=1 Tax=Spirosoma fluviale TaxID=1597977 RepID=A0A286FDN9_9BACT|nr:hypothetical protein [Spirosoma fluviale]SOD81216.1 hypothetical protein SAMN06269250_1714 [Spirosoma fluviale]
MNLYSTKTYSHITTSLLIICSIIFGYFIIKNANWTWGDDYEFLISTAVGKIEWDLHIANHGRLYPLGHFDFNILTFIHGADGPSAHYILVLISFFIFVFLSFRLYQDILQNTNANQKTISWIILISIIFLFYYFYKIFFFLVYSERIIIILLSLFFILYSKFLSTKKLPYAIITLIVSIYLCFTKETSFIIFGTVAGLNLLLNVKNISKREIIFYCILLVIIIIFLSVYYFVAYRSTDTYYSRHSTFEEVIKFSFRNLKILYIATALSIWRIYCILLQHDRKNFYIDSLLFSGILHAIANIILKMPMDYYYFPAVMLSLPALLHWGVRLYNPNWILTALILISGYYVRKFPETIESIQNLRITSNHQFQELTKLLNNVDSAYWLQEANVTSVNVGLMSYQRELLGVYYNYYNKSNKITEINNISKIPDFAGKKTVIFYSNYNNINNNQDSTLEKIYQLGYKKTNFSAINEINIFVN